MTDRELMQEVLEALQAVREAPASKDEIQRAWIVSDLLRRRLAQPEQEPVAWYCKEGLNRGVSLKQESSEWEPLYTISQHRRPLSDDEADEFVRRFARYELIRAIEAAHGIKE